MRDRKREGERWREGGTEFRLCLFWKCTHRDTTQWNVWQRGDRDVWGEGRGGRGVRVPQKRDAGAGAVGSGRVGEGGVWEQRGGMNEACWGKEEAGRGRAAQRCH